MAIQNSNLAPYFVNEVVKIVEDVYSRIEEYGRTLNKWDSRDRKKALHQESVPKRQFLIPDKNEKNEPLSASEKILLPPLHIKLGLMKNFVKAMDCGGSGFQYLRLKFPKVSETKIKEGIFVGPQFRQLMKSGV
ncbi:hypothetical protein AVEN_21314-1 [Araneus ventricosus]|uniref:Uncharacterized protein n=1 Tax=Araneus ventricosus TaxID=182803 RepID=A0A4Y2PP75_ARAVE|nr:hypothetical protein AVEN_21314-1 [Araneus ventricosus]